MMSLIKLIAALMVSGMCLGGQAAELAFSLQVLREFDDGQRFSGLVRGDDGAFYGTSFGATNRLASVFRITSTGRLTVLFSALEPGSFDPSGPLIQGKNRHFFGVTQFDNQGNGTVFDLAPTGELKILAPFGGTNGARPYGRLLQGADDNLYGTTQWGGINGQGTIFRVTQDGTLTTLYSFGLADGAQALGGLIEGTDGAIYGATTLDEHIFKITRDGKFTPLVHLEGTNGLGFVYLTLARDGNFYGTSIGGGALLGGTFFKMAPDGQFTSLAFFSPATGTFPNGLVERVDGDFYCSVQAGGPFRSGAVCKVTRAGEITTLAAFNGENGREPRGELVEGRDKNLYGVTRFGGKNNAGTFFRLTPTPYLSITQVGPAIVLTWNSFADAVYCLESKRSLAENMWASLVNGIPATGSTTSLMLNLDEASESYYRIVLEP